MPRLTPDDLVRYRAALYAGNQLEVSTMRLLIDEVEAAWADRVRQRIEIATKAAAALEKRRADVATYNTGACPKCHDAEARALLAKLKRIASDGTQVLSPRR